MAVFKFRISWEEDESVFRVISTVSGQTFSLFQDALLLAFGFKGGKPASFYESNENWLRKREISSEVASNKKGAAVLSSAKTPVSALVDVPDKRFLFSFDPDKDWRFRIQLIGMEKEANPSITYPYLVRGEGVIPQNPDVKNSPISLEGEELAQDENLDEDLDEDLEEDLDEDEDSYDLDDADLDDMGFSEE